MDLNSKLDLILSQPTVEVVQKDELVSLLETNSSPSHYVGFEISGKLHLGSLIVVGSKVNDLIKCGFKCKIFLADWHSVINEKLGGDWGKILKAADYFEEAFKLFCPGVEILRGSDLYHNNDAYWKKVVLLSRHVTLARDTRCLQIMGRKESESLHIAQYIYPPMQAVDINELQVDVTHAGLDQRKIHMLAREVFPKMNWKVPVALHTALLAGLLPPEQIPGDGEDSKFDKVVASKMSKSKPDTAIFVHDSSAEISRKISGAYCPVKVVEGNPVLDICKLILFKQFKALKVERPQKFGGDVEFASFDELEKEFGQGKLHPLDLKKVVAKKIDEVVSPIRSHFEKRGNLLDVFTNA